MSGSGARSSRPKWRHSAARMNRQRTGFIACSSANGPRCVSHLRATDERAQAHVL